MRICLVGDSFVQGTGDDRALGWPGRLVASLREKGRDVTGYNLGIRRESSADIALRWRAEVERRFRTDEPKRLAFSFGANDCASDENGEPRAPARACLAQAHQILIEAAGVAPTIMLGPAPILEDERADARVAALSRELGELCASLGAPYLEIFPFLIGCEAWRRDAAAGDGVHPHHAGYSALARFVEEWPALAGWLDGQA